MAMLDLGTIEVKLVREPIKYDWLTFTDDKDGVYEALTFFGICGLTPKELFKDRYGYWHAKFEVKE